MSYVCHINEGEINCTNQCHSLTFFQCTHSIIFKAVPVEGGTKGVPFSSTAHATLELISPVVINVINSPAFVNVNGKPEIHIYLNSHN